MSNSLYNNMIVDGIPYEEYKRNNYKPWYLELTTNRKGLTLDKYPNLSGDYFAFYPSLPIWENEGYKFKGKIYNLNEFKMVQHFPGTGGSLQSFIKI